MRLAHLQHGLCANFAVARHDGTTQLCDSCIASSLCHVLRCMYAARMYSVLLEERIVGAHTAHLPSGVSRSNPCELTRDKHSCGLMKLLYKSLAYLLTMHQPASFADFRACALIHAEPSLITRAHIAAMRRHIRGRSWLMNDTVGL